MHRQLSVPTPMGTPSPPLVYPEQIISIYNHCGVAPALGPYTDKLTVTDINGAIVPAYIVEVTVQSVAPEARSNQTVSQGSTVTLYVRGSTAFRRRRTDTFVGPARYPDYAGTNWCDSEQHVREKTPPTRPPLLSSQLDCSVLDCPQLQWRSGYL